MSERILLVDDEPHILRALQRLLRNGLKDTGGARYEGESFPDPGVALGGAREGAFALARARECAFALAISDQRMPGMTGVEFLSQLRQVQPDCGRIILSGYADLNALVAAINEAEIARFISKPWADFDLLSAVRQV